MAEHPTMYVYSCKSPVQADIWYLNAWNRINSDLWTMAAWKRLSDYSCALKHIYLGTAIQKKAFSKQNLSYLRNDPLIYTWNTWYIYVQYTHVWLHWCAPEGLTYSFQGYCVCVCVRAHPYVASWAGRVSPSALRGPCSGRWDWCCSCHCQWALQLPPALWEGGCWSLSRLAKPL